jgi:ABC-type amino acid transport substrate-binding protein
MAAFNRGLAEIMADGTYQKMEADLIAGGYDE